MSRVFVVGSINMDVVVTSERHPRPGETVPGSKLNFMEGGKGANQAVAASRAGADTLMVGRLGEDDFGRRLEAFLRDEDIDLEHVASEASVASGTAVVTVAGSDSTIVVVPGANGALAPEHVSTLPMAAEDLVVAQFETPLETVEAALRRARAQGATTILNPAPARECGPQVVSLADVLVVNETELVFLSKTEHRAGESRNRLIAAVRELRARESQAVVVTLGGAGALAIDREAVIEIEGRRVDAVDATGAGDCFVGNLAAGMSRAEPLPAALETANVAASLCVQSFGAGVSMPRLEEVRAAV
jgi:ribokinase